MVQQQLLSRGITDRKVLRAMELVPREKFVSADQQQLAYIDGPLPIGAGQTISQPYIVALMLSHLNISPEDTVLEIGTGSGYAAAVMSLLATHVYTIERHAELARTASERLKKLGYHNVTVIHGDGTKGLPEYAPYKAIMVSAAGKEVPPPLLEQLAPLGRLIIPLGPQGDQNLVLFRQQDPHNPPQPIYLSKVRFVPLLPGLPEAPISPSREQTIT